MREKTTSIQSWRARGAALAKAQRYDEANAAYDKALELAPEDARTLAGKGWVAEQQDRDEDAIRYFEQALASDPEYTYAARHRALALARLGLLEEAVDAYTCVLELDPSDVEIWRCKCGCLYRLKRYDDALDTYDQALDIAPDNAMLWHDKASTLIEVDRYQDALECAERALQLANADAITLNTKGCALAKLKRFQEAFDCFTQAAEKAPQTAYIWCNRAHIESELGRYDAALESMDRAIELEPGNADASVDRATYLQKLERRDEAIASAARATGIAPENGEIWWQRAKILYQFGRYEEANSVIDIAAHLSPENPNILRWQTFIHDAMKRPFEDKTLSLRDGRTLGYCDYGDPNGMPLVYCHGLPGSRLIWFLNADELVSRHIRLIVPDRPGFGLSTFKKSKLLDWPNDLVELLDSLDIECFTIVGASGGGGWAMACALRFPERVTKLGLISTVAPYGNPGTDIDALRFGRIRRRLLRVVPWSIHRLLGAGIARIVYAYPKLAYMRLQYVPDFADIKTNLPLTPRQIEEVKAEYGQHGAGSTWETRLYNRSWGFNPERIQVPTWLWHGEKDTLAPISGARYLASAIPNCHATFYPDDTHHLFGKHRSEIVSVLSGSNSE